MKRRFSYTLAVLVCAALGTAAKAQDPANIVTNPGFETGDFTGWTLAGGMDAVSVTTFNPQAGNYAATFGPSTTGSLSQILPTAAGSLYDLSFYLSPTGGGGGPPVAIFSPAATTQDPEFQAYFNGVLVYDTATAGPLDPAYNFVSITGLQATTNATTLEFDYINTENFYNLDTITVVPEPSSICLASIGALAGFGAWRVSRCRRVMAA